MNTLLAEISKAELKDLFAEAFRSAIADASTRGWEATGMVAILFFGLIGFAILHWRTAKRVDVLADRQTGELKDIAVRSATALEAIADERRDRACVLSDEKRERLVAALAPHLARELNRERADGITP